MVHRFLSPEKFTTLQDKFNKKGTLFILFGRPIIGLRVQAFLVSGTMKMPSLKFLTTDVLTVIFTMGVWAGV